MKKFKKYLSLVLIATLIISYNISIAQDFESEDVETTDYEKVTEPVVGTPSRTAGTGDACLRAHSDIEQDFNKWLWMGLGFGSGLLAGAGAIPLLLVAYLMEPSPPASRLVGKNPEYVAVYKDCYRQRGKNKQLKTTLLGCGAGAGCCIASYLTCCLVSPSYVWYPY